VLAKKKGKFLFFSRKEGAQGRLNRKSKSEAHIFSEVTGKKGNIRGGGGKKKGGGRFSLSMKKRGEGRRREEKKRALLSFRRDGNRPSLKSVFSLVGIRGKKRGLGVAFPLFCGN